MSKTFIVSDVFGLTDCLEEFSDYFPESIIVDPYDGQKHHFLNEEEAYGYFMQNCGIEGYTDVLLSAIGSDGCGSRIIAFSAGASAAWNISDKFTDIAEIVCFYGSRIRDNADIKPLCPVKLIFPAYEKSFDVSALSEKLKRRINVTVERIVYLHGFMNRLSVNFDETGYLKYLNHLTHTDHS